MSGLSRARVNTRSVLRHALAAGPLRQMGTVRPLDRQDAAMLRQRFNLKEEG